MKWMYREPVTGASKDELRLGIASWDDGSGTAMSIKYTWFDSLGRAARGGEMPVEALPQALEFARRHGFLRRARRR